MATSGPTTAEAELHRATSLRDAETKALALFNELAEKIIRPNVSEAQLSREIHELGAEHHHGVRTHWHKRIVRSGPNTLRPFDENPPDRIVQPDDILVVDLGPVFEFDDKWEADFGRTFVFGEDPAKIRLRDNLEPVWQRVKALFDAKADEITGEELFDIAVAEAKAAGFDWGADIAGHIVGHFPHERIPKDKLTLYIAKGNQTKMRRPGKDGFVRHWILEIHLRDPSGDFGGFYEQLLTC
ncbi:peptidase M24, structural domain-containing protein [Mycena amicta]|nr:peptidase M24, structural domain-containing protein [Mycena amicta]